MKENQNKQFYNQKPTLHLNGKMYKFSNLQLMNFLVGAPLLSIFLYLFLRLKINYWIYEFTSIQISFFLNSIFNMNSTVIFYPDHNTFPTILIPNHPFEGLYAITTNCIAGHIFCIIIGIILFIPSSKEHLSKKNFIWRKMKTLTISILGIYILNLFRIVFLLFFNFKGIPFEVIHESLFFLSAIVGALFVVILLKNWLPEIFISIYYMYSLISQKRKEE
jgi:exosortase/archaeosortase family protein